MRQLRWIAFALFVILVSPAFARPAAASTAASIPSVTLEWTAPGDDSLVGNARFYDLRFSRYPITAQNFAFATRLNGVLLPGPPGTVQRFTLFGLTPGVQYYFAIRSGDEAGNWSAISNVVNYAAGTVDVLTELPAEPHFSSPYPNPAVFETRFTLSLPGPRRVLIEAFDLAGRRVRTIARGEYSGGTFTLAWNVRDEDGRPLKAGAYLVRGQIGESVFLRRVAVVR